LYVQNTKEITDGSQTWKQTFVFDRYGNRRFDFAGGATTAPESSCTEAICNPTINASNNRISSSGYSFDNAGNTTADAQGRTFVYDAENKQIEVIDDSVTVGEYFYDGDGKRIKKYVPSTGETTVFVYDAAGKLVAEYSTIVASTNDAKVAYLTNDHLGSPRINTDLDGDVIARHDYHPFGEEIATSQRTSGLGYSADTIRKKFTGYERDYETELDFAQARYYAKNLGRFTSVDEPFFDQYEDNPQSWNLYTYVRNNPLNLNDPTGQSANDPQECPEGKICTLDKDGKIIKIEDDKDPIRIDTSVEALRLRGGDPLRGIRNLIKWIGHWFGRKPAQPRNAPRGTTPVPTGAAPAGPSQRPVTVRIDPRQTQKKFKHAKDFGVQANWNAQNGQQFQQAIQSHLNNPATQAIPGTYRHTQSVIHFYNPQTSVNVIINSRGEFVSGWRLSSDQIHAMTTRGSLW
jgi:RHS repeat-associated protein